MVREIVLAFSFGALNVYLWSLPISAVRLFLVTAPLGVLYFCVIFRFYGRRRS